MSIASFVIGLPVAALFWLAVSPAGQAVKPTGRLAERYQAEATEAIRGVAGPNAVVECTMMGNVNWAVNCRSDGVMWVKLAGEFERRGWVHTPESTAVSPQLARDSDRISIQFGNGAVHVSLRPKAK